MDWTVASILQATGGRLLSGAGNRPFAGVAIDSRTIAPDELFVAIMGQRHDGHAFINQVLEKGVRGLVIAEAYAISADIHRWASCGATCVAVADTTRALGRLAAYQRSQVTIPVVAITGSNGKTSTRKMAALVLEQAFMTLSTQGNLNNEIGVPLTLFGLNREHRAAVLELGMNHPGEIDRLGAICRPTIGVITNVAAAHLEFLGNPEGVARAKAELVGHIDSRGVLILNRDDRYVQAMARQAQCRVFFFGMTPAAHVHAGNVQETGQGVTFDLVLPGDRITVGLKSAGRFMVANALAAASVGHLCGLHAGQIKAGLEAFQAEKGRLQIKNTPNGIHIIDDTYNANPQSVTAALETLSVLKGAGTAFVVLGDMLELGAQSAELHTRIGRQVVQSGAAQLFLHGDFAECTAKGAQTAGMAPGDIFHGSRKAIAEEICRRIQPGQWVLVKGSRGMAMEEVVAALWVWGQTAAKASTDRVGEA